MKTTKLDRVRRRLAMAIAENIEARFIGPDCDFDFDGATDVIADFIPHDRVEMEAAIEELCITVPVVTQAEQETHNPLSPEDSHTGRIREALIQLRQLRRVLDQLRELREALGLPITADLRETLTTAIATVANMRALLEEVRDNYDCDTGANNTHPPYCRSCNAAALLTHVGSIDPNPELRP